MISCPVARCDRPRPGHRTVCGACESDLLRALGDVPWLAQQLDIALARQTSKTAGGRSASVPLPYDPRATEAGYVLRSALVGWVRVLQEGLEGVAVPEGPTCVRCQHPSCRWILWLPGPADTLGGMARWLLEGSERLVGGPWADEAVEEITSAVWAAKRVIDRPPGMLFAGPCGCGAALYARPGSARTTCRTCRAEHDVEKRREQMLDDIEGMLLTASQCAHALTALEWPVTAERVRQWGCRRRIVEHGKDAQGRPLYLVREVRELLAKADRKTEESRTKRAERVAS